MEWTVGNTTITQVRECLMPMNPSEFFSPFDEAVFESHASWLKPNYVDDAGNVVMSIHALIVRSCGKTIVIDPCMGNDRPLPAGLPTLQTDFLERLEAIVPRHEVDFVLCTHLHCDHVGWNTMLDDGAWVPTFPNAAYLLGRREYEHWSSGEEHGFIDLEFAVKPIVDAGLHRLVDPGFQVTEEMTLISTPGHTPGHLSIRLNSAGEEAWITGDVVHSPLQLVEADWGMLSDYSLDEARTTRHSLVRQMCDAGALVIGTHFPEPTVGRLVEVGGRMHFKS